MSYSDPIFGLVLAGGKSRRMGRDKASIAYAEGKPHWRITAGIIAPFCKKVLISVRDGQTLEGHSTHDANLLVDDGESNGPIAGVLTAMRARPEHAILAVACDLPLLGSDVIEHLLESRGKADAVAYKSAFDGLPEPLCTLYEPAFYEVLMANAGAGRRCPRKILINESSRVQLLDLPRVNALDNANTPEDFDKLKVLAGTLHA